jgi:putative copper export protein
MIPITSVHVRLFLHVLGACIWIGGQLVLAGLVPVVRRASSPDVLRAVGRQFQRLAWPGYALLLATGIWNLFAVHVTDYSSEQLATLFVKLVLVALSGIGAAFHALMTGPSVSRATDEAQLRRRRAVSGVSAGFGLLFALIAAFLGIQLHG